MSGIILLLVLAIWIYIVKKLSGLFTSNMQPGNRKIIVYTVLFIIFFIAPVADEIVGGFQFRALCTPDNLLVYDPDNVRGKTVKTNGSTVRTRNKIIPIRELTREWFDIDSGEILITHKMYYAKGGWVSRFIGFPQGSPPYTFDGHCDLKEYYLLFKELNVKKIEN